MVSTVGEEDIILLAASVPGIGDSELIESRKLLLLLLRYSFYWTVISLL